MEAHLNVLGSNPAQFSFCFLQAITWLKICLFVDASEQGLNFKVWMSDVAIKYSFIAMAI